MSQKIISIAILNFTPVWSTGILLLLGLHWIGVIFWEDDNDKDKVVTVDVDYMVEVEVVDNDNGREFDCCSGRICGNNSGGYGGSGDGGPNDE